MKPLAQNTLIQNRYLVVHLIGKGGMGEVYLAVDQRLGSAVALKRTFFAGDEMLGNAFEREARTLARLRHPVLPKVSDHFTENQEQYLVMEHISGDDLSKRLELAQKSFPLSWVLFWADQLLDALSYLHSHEPPIIHRDIKPQNLKLTDENHIILLDFGLSKISTGQTHISATGSTGSVVGYTPHYAPMEQIRGVGTNARSDLYSLSATLYQLLTNVVPPDALTRADSMLNGGPDPLQPIHAINPEIPQLVSDVIMRGMEVSQDKRFSNAREMQKALRKAYSEMQEAMAAQTVMMSAAELQQQASSLIEKPKDSELRTALMAPTSSSQVHGSAPNSNPPATGTPIAPPDLEATIAFDPAPATESRKQSDIKTEVFTGGTSPFSVPPSTPPSGGTSWPDTSSRPVDSRGDSWPEQELRETSFDEVDEPIPAEVIPDATVPFIALDKTAEQPLAPPTDTFTVPVGGNGSYAGTSHPAGFTSQPAPPPAKPAPVAKKGGGGKAAALLGGLAALFILAIGAAAVGYYVYTNYAATATEEATPTPAPTIAATPTVEPTLETASETNTSSDSNTNTSTEALTVDPTPEPVQQTPQQSQPNSPVSRPTPQVVTRTTPARTTQTPVVQKPTPKPADDRTKILQ
jgi:serine/threonine protein kinase